MGPSSSIANPGSATSPSNSACAAAIWAAPSPRRRSSSNADVHLERGYTIRWDGQFNEMKVAQQKLMLIIPLALIAIFVLLCLAFRGIKDAAWC